MARAKAWSVFGPHDAEVRRVMAEIEAQQARAKEIAAEMRRIVQELAEVKPIRERVLDNMGSPGRFSECLFCHADDYDGWAGHREACLWERAKRLVEGNAAD